jgi:hypothetical protein
VSVACRPGQLQLQLQFSAGLGSCSYSCSCSAGLDSCMLQDNSLLLVLPLHQHSCSSISVRNIHHLLRCCCISVSCHVCLAVCRTTPCLSVRVLRQPCCFAYLT